MSENANRWKTTWIVCAWCVLVAHAMKLHAAERRIDVVERTCREVRP